MQKNKPYFKKVGLYQIQKLCTAEETIEMLLLNQPKIPGFWPLEENNSIRGEKQGLITQAFCNKVVLKYKGDKRKLLK